MKVERKGVEPSTSALRTQPLRDVSYTAEGVAASDPTACTEDQVSAKDDATTAAQNDPGLQAVVQAWPALPEALRRAILALANWTREP